MFIKETMFPKKLTAPSKKPFGVACSEKRLCQNLKTVCIYIFCGLAQCRRHTHRPFVPLLFCSAMNRRSGVAVWTKHPRCITLALNEFLKQSLWLMNVCRHFFLRHSYFCISGMKPCEKEHNFHIVIMKKAGNNIVQRIWDRHHILKVYKK